MLEELKNGVASPRVELPLLTAADQFILGVREGEREMVRREKRKGRKDGVSEIL